MTLGIFQPRSPGEFYLIFQFLVRALGHFGDSATHSQVEKAQ